MTTHDASAFESNTVAIVASLAFSFIVCIIVLVRCTWTVYNGSRSLVQRSANRETKESIIEVLPKFTYNSAMEDKGCGNLSSSDCAICLAEYADGDEISVLPMCGHGFHVVCIDTWLTSNSSCPSCRQIHIGHLVVQR